MDINNKLFLVAIFIIVNNYFLAATINLMQNIYDHNFVSI